jgi:hypothetical protein
MKNGPKTLQAKSSSYSSSSSSSKLLFDVESKMWTGVGRFVVPKGRNDSSLAVYCLECDQRTTRPVGHGLSWSAGVFTASGTKSMPESCPQNRRHITNLSLRYHKRSRHTTRPHGSGSRRTATGQTPGRSVRLALQGSRQLGNAKQTISFATR